MKQQRHMTHTEGGKHLTNGITDHTSVVNIGVAQMVLC